MARFARVVVADVAHHVTQRGNARQVILSSDRGSARLIWSCCGTTANFAHALVLLGYCLMSNHVHLIAVPRACEALAQTLKHAHGRYASYWNARNSSSGHVWQGRFYSCPLDETNLWRALRYVEMNPVRAGMAPEYAVAVVKRGGAFAWQRRSAGSGSKWHTGGSAGRPQEWIDYLAASGIGQRCGDAATIHAHRKAAGIGGICCPLGALRLCGLWFHGSFRTPEKVLSRMPRAASTLQPSPPRQKQ